MSALPGWLGSLRFRLTAFYTVLLAAVIIALSVSLSFILERQLEDDLDDRLRGTVDQFEQLVDRTAPRKIDIPDLEPFSSSAVFIQFTDIYGNTETSVNLQGSRIPTPQLPITKPVFWTETTTGVDLRILSSPYITEDNLSGGYITIATPRDSVNRTVDLLQRLLLWGALVGISGAVISGWLLAGRALRPINRMTATAASIANSSDRAVNLAARLDEPHANDEVSRLARTFNAMLDRLETAFVAQRRFLADASHELRTPLTALRGNADVLRRQAESWPDRPERDDTIAALDDMRRESARMSRLVSDLLLLARTDAPENQSAFTPVPFGPIATEAVRSIDAITSGRTVTVVGEPAVVLGDADRLRQLVIILVDNAIRHTSQDGHISVSTALDGEGRPTLTVSDDGEGIAPEHVPHIFDRFYRADSARARATGGTGLGLAIARSIVADHDGVLDVESLPAEGSTFRVVFPRV